MEAWYTIAVMGLITFIWEEMWFNAVGRQFTLNSEKNYISGYTPFTPIPVSISLENDLKLKRLYDFFILNLIRNILVLFHRNISI